MRDGAGRAGVGKRALVTGGAVRVGRELSLALAHEGWDVAVHYHSSEAEAEATADCIRDMGRTAVALRADLREAERISPLMDRAADGLGGLELLVNNAAVFPRARPEQVTAAVWDDVFALNARAPFLCAVEARRHMQTGGSIVNVADVAAFEGWPSYAPYAASKAALVSLTRSLAVAWAPRVRVNAVAPGTVLPREDAGEAESERARRRSLLEASGRPRDVAEAVLYLAGADFVTGEVIRVDGGAHVARPRRS